MRETPYMGATSAGVDYADVYAREFHSVVRALQPWVGASADDIGQEAFVAASRRTRGSGLAHPTAKGTSS